jgi:tetratricopeptide (TPR) repeat protein
MAVARGVAVCLLLVTAACAPKVPPAAPAAPKYPDFTFPTVPAALQGAKEAARIDAGWRYLQNDQLGPAEREFEAALKANSRFYPARAGEGYVALARKNYERAVTAFNAALAAAPAYTPALLGKGDALLALKRDEEALAAFQAALAAEPSRADLQRRVELLRFRTVQDVLARARVDAAAGRLAQARADYMRALEASPDSGFVYRELGVVERKMGDTDAALMHLRRASELDPTDAAAFLELGQILEARGDFAGAEAAYRKANDLQPSADLLARISAAAEKARDAALPPAYHAIPSEAQITRGELAALIGVRLEPLLRNVPARQVVVTDIRGHWAASWITAVVRAGIMEPFPNHTFQPRSRVSRADLASAVSRVIALVGERNPTVRVRAAQRPAIADLPPTHLSYPAAAIAVATGVMPLADGRRFQPTRPVSGAEAVQTIDRLRALHPGGR